MTNYTQLYLENQEFHDYVNRLMRPGKNDANVELDKILARKTVKAVGDYYKSKPESEQNPGFPGVPERFCDCEDKSC
jgi:hypothetical protein